MNEIRTIAEVIEALDELVKNCMLTQNRAGYFAALYKRMTKAVADGIQQGHFQDGQRMEALDVVFAKRYLNAIAAFQQGNPVISSWQNAFVSSGNSSLIVLQHLLLGINTHINLDLAIAAATVAPGDKIYSLQTDFGRINSLIAALVDDVQHCLEQIWFPMRFFRNIVNKQGHAVMNFSIQAARETSWVNAVALATMNPDEQARHIGSMDVMTRNVGAGITYPGTWPSLVLKLVRLTENGDPS